ncbi:MAG: hydroxypyruvate isomerase family protein [Verrucomicrobiia bacterium]
MKTINRRHFLGQSASFAAGFAALKTLSPACALAADATAPSGGPKLSACIEAVFNKGPFEQRLDPVKASGLTVFEFWGWRNRDLDALLRKKEETGLELAAFSSETGGPLVAPGSAEKFVPALKDSIAVAKKLGCKRLIVTVGNEMRNVPRSDQHKNIVEAFRVGAPVCEDAGITLVLEPLNVLVNHKGYYLATSAEGFQIIDEVGSPNVKLLFDIYHQQITEGNLIQNITRNIATIGHFHVADVPGRHQPGTGEINYAGVFKAIMKTGYDGFLGLEMWPTIDHATAVKQTLALFNGA